ncbi:hypothetical protein HDV06_003857 [Boothiomyces sp. JEL0866]|nr:hypothetical protein HDV06_003857 [Boothiomyces sp. JEL0866]
MFYSLSSENTLQLLILSVFYILTVLLACITNLMFFVKLKLHGLDVWFKQLYFLLNIFSTVGILIRVYVSWMIIKELEYGLIYSCIEYALIFAHNLCLQLIEIEHLYAFKPLFGFTDRNLIVLQVVSVCLNLTFGGGYFFMASSNKLLRLWSLYGYPINLFLISSHVFFQYYILSSKLQTFLLEKVKEKILIRKVNSARIATFFYSFWWIISAMFTMFNSSVNVTSMGFDGIVGSNAMVNLCHGNYAVLNILGLINLFYLKDIVKCFKNPENQTEVNK